MSIRNKWVIQVLDNRRARDDGYVGFFWGGQKGPFKDVLNEHVERFATKEEAQANAGCHLNDKVRVVHMDDILAAPPIDLHLGDNVDGGFAGTFVDCGPVDLHRPETHDIENEPRYMPRQLRGYTSAERKEIPLHTLVAEYFPDALAAVARHSKKANEKHNPGEPMHWARKKSTDHLNCAMRHLATPDAIDADTGEIELVGAAWRCLAALQPREDDRLMAGPLSEAARLKSLSNDYGTTR